MSQSKPNTPKRPGFPLSLDSISGVGRSALYPSALSQTAAVRAPASARSYTPTGLGLDSAAVRSRMVEQLARVEGISHPAVLHAMRTVERHRFVDSALVVQAYEDTSLPIGLQQTISKPSVVARMLELLLAAPAVLARQQPRVDGLPQSGNLRPMGRVLEIGTGCGYQAAVLACVAEHVVSIERLRGLHDKASANLARLSEPLMNLTLIFGDGMLGHAEAGPYEGIISAAGGDNVPQAWIEQLAMGGRLVAPTATTGGAQQLLVVDKTPQGLVHTVLETVHFVPLCSGVA